jgi:hypothetical protein
VTGLTENGRVSCQVPRETIQKLRPYSEAIGREIQLERQKIVEKLAQSRSCRRPRLANPWSCFRGNSKIDEGPYRREMIGRV